MNAEDALQKLEGENQRLKYQLQVINYSPASRPAVPIGNPEVI